MICLGPSRKTVLPSVVVRVMFQDVDTSIALDNPKCPRGGTAGFGFFHETMNFMNFTSAVARN